MSEVCGTGGWAGPEPGDPDNNLSLMATPAFGGVDVSWTFPEVHPEAVAHTELYRGTDNQWDNAVLHKHVNGDSYYDKTTTATAVQYYYWIIVVSIHGTRGERIGPTSSLARPTIEQTMENLTARIDAGHLAQSLKNPINQVATNQQAISEEKTARAAADDLLGYEYNVLRTRADEADAAIVNEREIRISEDSSLSQQLDTVQSTLSDDTASVQVSLNTEIERVDGELQNIGARYTAQVQANGLIGGFGIYNDGTEVQAGFDVDTFWVGRTATDGIKPFIIDGTTGNTYIRSAVIQSLEIDKLKSSDNAFAFENGKLRSDLFEVERMESPDGNFVIDMQNKFIKIEV